jgi:selenide,water dikinase
MGVHTGGEGRNREWASPHVSFEAVLEPALEALLWDPQTSGGLLFGCPRRRAAALEASFAADGEPLWRIGQVAAGEAGISVT